MENIVDNFLIVKMTKDLTGEEITEEDGERIMLEMEIELKDFLFNGSNLDENYKDLVKNKYIQWINNDKTYPLSVDKYIKGKVSSDKIKFLPYCVLVLLIKYIKKNAYEDSLHLSRQNSI